MNLGTFMNQGKFDARAHWHVRMTPARRKLAATVGPLVEAMDEGAVLDSIKNVDSDLLAWRDHGRECVDRTDGVMEKLVDRLRIRGFTVKVVDGDLHGEAADKREEDALHAAIKEELQRIGDGRVKATKVGTLSDMLQSFEKTFGRAITEMHAGTPDRAEYGPWNDAQSTPPPDAKPHDARKYPMLNDKLTLHDAVYLATLEGGKVENIILSVVRSIQSQALEVLAELKDWQSNTRVRELADQLAKSLDVSARLAAAEAEKKRERDAWLADYDKRKAEEKAASERPVTLEEVKAAAEAVGKVEVHTNQHVAGEYQRIINPQGVEEAAEALARGEPVVVDTTRNIAAEMSGDVPVISTDALKRAIAEETGAADRAWEKEPDLGDI